MTILLLDTADECSRWLVRYGVTPRQIRDWARRGRITRYGDLFCAAEIADYLDNRSNANHRRAVVSHLRSGKRTATMRPRDASPETG
ncbi:MAG TPA: hypothetical protein VFH74_13425 [Gaiellales bacterium]|nr:hypothetical protein [Gaiellales bacterium]